MRYLVIGVWLLVAGCESAVEQQMASVSFDALDNAMIEEGRLAEIAGYTFEYLDGHLISVTLKVDSVIDKKAVLPMLGLGGVASTYTAQNSYHQWSVTDARVKDVILNSNDSASLVMINYPSLIEYSVLNK